MIRSDGEMKLRIPNEETLAAMKELEERDKIQLHLPEKYWEPDLRNRYLLVPSILHVVLGYFPYGDSERMVVIFQQVDSSLKFPDYYREILIFSAVSGLLFGILTMALRKRVKFEVLMTFSWGLLTLNLLLGFFTAFSPVFLLKP